MFAIVFAIVFANLQQSFLQFTNFVYFATIYLISYNLQQICKFCSLFLQNCNSIFAKILRPFGAFSRAKGGRIMIKFRKGTQEDFDRIKREKGDSIEEVSIYLDKEDESLYFIIKEDRSDFESYIKRELGNLI